MRAVWFCFAMAISGTVFAGSLPLLDPKDGIIFPASHARELLQQCSRASPLNVQGTWLPSIEQIRELEARLPSALTNEASKISQDNQPDASYGRQYGGLIISNMKIIYVNAFPHHANDSVDMPYNNLVNDNWSIRPVLVCDGGAGFFGVEYDPKTKTFSHFEFNGVA